MITSKHYILIERYIERETSEKKYEKLIQRLIQDDKDFDDFYKFIKEKKINMQDNKSLDSQKLIGKKK